MIERRRRRELDIVPSALSQKAKNTGHSSSKPNSSNQQQQQFDQADHKQSGNKKGNKKKQQQQPQSQHADSANHQNEGDYYPNNKSNSLNRQTVGGAGAAGGGNNNNSLSNKNHSKQTLNSNSSTNLTNRSKQQNQLNTSSSSSSLSTDHNNQSPRIDTRQANNPKALAHKVKRMEIGGIENSGNNTNNRSLLNGLNDSDHNNQNDNLLDHPPTKRLLTSPQLNYNNNNSNDVKMDTSASNNHNDSANDGNNNEESMICSQGDVDNDESRSEATFSFVITEFSKFRESRESRLSPACVVRNLPWKILAMSKPPANNNKDFALGFFLQCNADSESNRWSIYAMAELRLVHTTDPEKNVVKKIQHLFFSKENDWGFSPFLNMKEIMDPERGFYDAQRDCITLEVWVNADAPHGTAWDSKKFTGFVGLTNQGATCYMNSLLQTLYFTSELRKAVYKLPTENDDPIKSIPLALQRVFFDLQFSEKSVGTKKLTRSFGWETFDTFMQHDVQELCRVLLDNLENKMKHTSVEGCIPRLYEGKMISYIKCKSIEYESRRVEPFYDIQLNIKGKKDIYESFKDYITVETLEGDNKYDAGSYGLQEAQKGVIFESFPPILHLHLMRFQYDPQTDSNIKINDRYEFFEEIQLDDYLDKKQSSPALYRLHAVLVHSGDNHGGHYVVFMCPKLDGKWFKFDDEVVSRCSKRDAITANFGGTQADDLTYRTSTNAYMLVYVRDSFKDFVLSDVTKADIPQALQDRLGEEKRMEALRKKEKNEAHLFMQVNVVIESDFYDNLGYADLYDVKSEASRTLKVRKTSTMTETMKQIADSLNLSVDEIRVWSLMTRYNNTIRPYNCVDMRDAATKSVVDVSKQDALWTVFVETCDDLSLSANYEFVSLLNQPPPAQSPSIQGKQKLPPFNVNEEVMIFFKYYDPKSSALRYVFKLYISKKSTLNAIQERVNKKMKFPPNTDLLFFEEVRISQIKPILVYDKPLDKLAHEELLTGDIYVFQVNEKEKLKTYELPTVDEYFSDLVLHVDIVFCEKVSNTSTVSTVNSAGNNNGANADDGTFTLNISLKLKYDEFAKIVAEKLEYDPKKIQFFRQATPGAAASQLNTTYELRTNTPLTPIKYNPDFTLQDAFRFSMQQSPQQPNTGVRKLYYQKLKIPLVELEERRQFRCTWVSANLKVEREITFMPLKKATVKELLAECRKELLREQLITQEEFDDENNFRLRLVEVAGCKISRQFKEDLAFESLVDSNQTAANKMYRVEQIMPDEFEFYTSGFKPSNSENYLLPVAHFCKEVYATFGTPFMVRVRLGEPFKDIKQRIQRRLEINDKDFATYRFALVSMGIQTYVPDEEDYKLDLSNQVGVQPWLGIEHQNKAANKTKNKFSTMEKAIKIFN